MKISYEAHKATDERMLSIAKSSKNDIRNNANFVEASDNVNLASASKR